MHVQCASTVSNAFDKLSTWLSLCNVVSFDCAMSNYTLVSHHAPAAAVCSCCIMAQSRYLPSATVWQPPTTRLLIWLAQNSFRCAEVCKCLIMCNVCIADIVHCSPAHLTALPPISMSRHPARHFADVVGMLVQIWMALWLACIGSPLAHVNSAKSSRTNCS